MFDTMIQSEHMYSESSLWPCYTGRINLLGLGESIAAGEALVELADVVVERVVEAEMAQLSLWVAARGLGELREALPGWSTLVSLQPVVPLLSGSLHVERSQPYLLILWSMYRSEELLTTVKPW
jgi:hypothetical protein